jgi:Brp/Blh family beta-carotene 15,15'-monooxygenase
MTKYSNFAIVASFFGLWLDSSLTETAQTWVGFILVLSFGILHGANDLLLIKKVNGQSASTPSYYVLVYYIIVVLFGALLFYTIPWFALVLFVLVSGYHFGEQHWNKKLQTKNKGIKFIFEIQYGLLLLFLIFVFHDQEVQKIIFSITAVTIPIVYFWVLLKILIITFAGSCLYYNYVLKNFKSPILTELFYLLLFAVLFKVSSLIWAFALYFIFWHSIPSMMDQIKFLYLEVTWATFRVYFRSAYIYWIVSLAGIAALYLIFRNEKTFHALFFSFLASITFPHVIVILAMFGRKKRKQPHNSI